MSEKEKPSLTKKPTLTKKQRIVLECLDWFIEEHGYSPTYDELGELLNCDHNTVFKKVMILIDKGYVSCVNGKSRTLRVVMRYD